MNIHLVRNLLRVKLGYLAESMFIFDNAARLLGTFSISHPLRFIAFQEMFHPLGFLGLSKLLLPISKIVRSEYLETLVE